MQLEFPAHGIPDREFVSEDGVKYRNYLRYGDREALAFLVSQGPHTFASATRVLNEVCAHQQDLSVFVLGP